MAESEEVVPIVLRPVAAKATAAKPAGTLEPPVPAPRSGQPGPAAVEGGKAKNQQDAHLEQAQLVDALTTNLAGMLARALHESVAAAVRDVMAAPVPKVSRAPVVLPGGIEEGAPADSVPGG
jgi:hypothetical protein